MRVFLSLYMLSCAVYTRGEPAMPSQSEAFPLRDDTEILPAGEDMSKLTGMRQGNKIGGIFNEMNFDKMMTPTLPDEALTDLPDYLVREAMNADFGKYKNTRFHYQNHQDMWELPRPTGLMFRHNCLRQFITCMLAQSSPEPVCAYNHVDYSSKLRLFWTSDSYCHVFFDNCRRRFRVWRVLDTGICQFQYQDSADFVAKDIPYRPNYLNHEGKYVKQE